MMSSEIWDFRSRNKDRDYELNASPLNWGCDVGHKAVSPDLEEWLDGPQNPPITPGFLKPHQYISRSKEKVYENSHLHGWPQAKKAE